MFFLENNYAPTEVNIHWNVDTRMQKIGVWTRRFKPSWFLNVHVIHVHVLPICYTSIPHQCVWNSYTGKVCINVLLDGIWPVLKYLCSSSLALSLLSDSGIKLDLSVSACELHPIGWSLFFVDLTETKLAKLRKGQCLQCPCWPGPRNLIQKFDLKKNSALT